MKRFGTAIAVAISTASLAIGPAIVTTSPSFTARVGSGDWLAKAQATPIAYVPPDRGQPYQTQGTGSRGCERPDNAEGTGTIDVTLVAPPDHVGQTVSERPVFYWNAPKAVDLPVEFTLVEDDNPEPIHVQRFDRLEAGMTSVTLPEDKSLEVGHTYRWTVSVVCNNQRRSADVFAQSWIQRVEPSATLQMELDAASTALDMANAYGASSVWFDAIAALPSDAERLEVLEAALAGNTVSANAE